MNKNQRQNLIVVTK